MKTSVKIPLVVGEQEAAVLDSQSRIANWLYNKLLEQANVLRLQYRATQEKQVGKVLYTERGLRDLIPGLKAQHPFLKTVYSSVSKMLHCGSPKRSEIIRMANMDAARTR